MVMLPESMCGLVGSAGVGGGGVGDGGGGGDTHSVGPHCYITIGLAC